MAIELDNVIADIISEIGTDAIVVDAADVAAIECGGFLVDQPQPVTDVLTAILDCYDLIARQDNGTLTILPRGSEDQILIAADDLSAHEPGKEVDKSWNITDVSDINLPRKVVINFIDPTIEWQKAAVDYRKVNGTTEEIESFNLPFTMAAEEARYIAKRKCLSSYLNRKAISIFLPPKYVTLRENDILLIPDGDEYIIVRVSNVIRGLNYLIEVKGKIDNTLDSAFTMEAENKNITQNIIAPVPVGFQFIDICSLSDTYLNNAGYYAAAYSIYIGQTFKGAALYDGYNAVIRFPYGSTAGYLTNTLGDASGYTWDRSSKITVKMMSGTLSSVTEAQCLAGSNRAIVGAEIIGFQNATLVGTNTYELSKLIRGIGDTRDFISEHESGESFLLLETAKLKFKTLNNSEIGIEKSFKIVSTGQYIDDVTALDITPQANNLSPFAPCYIRTEFDTDGNLNIEWCRRTRSIVNLLTTLPIPLSEATEAYEIDIVVSGSVIRTIEATSESCQYTAAQILADSITAADIESIRIYQLSAIVGRGKPGVKTL